MRAFVPIEDLVPERVLQAADDFSFEGYVYESVVRGHELQWLCPSRRLLWMAVGHEYIEPELLDWIDALPRESILFDIGASNGIFALYAAAKSIRTIAFEPDPSNFFMLSYNNYLNKKKYGFEIESCLNLAVPDNTALASTQIEKMELGGHKKISNADTDVFGNKFVPEHSHRVLQVSCDDVTNKMGLPAPTHMKIDVDGSEQALLAGARETFTRVESVFIEVTDTLLDSFVLQFMADAGLTLQNCVQVQNYAGLLNCTFQREHR